MDVTFTMSSVGFSFVPFEVRPIGREDANVHERSTPQNEHDSMHLLPAGIKKKRTLEMRGVRVKDEAERISSIAYIGEYLYMNIFYFLFSIQNNSTRRAGVLKSLRRSDFNLKRVIR